MSLAGRGYKPPQAALEVPDFTGLKVTGTTVTYFQGNARTGSLTEPPFAPVTVRPVASFSGFNPLLNQSFNLPAGAVLTMFTELKVENAPLLTWCDWCGWWDWRSSCSWLQRWSPGNASARRAERFSTQRELACEWFDEADSSDLAPDQS